jgi:hypothetical protein
MVKAPSGRPHPPVEYRFPKGRLWHAAEIAHIRVVAPAIDGPNLCLVIRFEHMGQERFAHWIGEESWRTQPALKRRFGESKGEDAGTGVGDAPAETVAIWVKIVATMAQTSSTRSRSGRSSSGSQRR